MGFHGQKGEYTLPLDTNTTVSIRIPEPAGQRFQTPKRPKTDEF